jgi:hypothetical protein
VPEVIGVSKEEEEDAGDAQTIAKTLDPSLNCPLAAPTSLEPEEKSRKR